MKRTWKKIVSLALALTMVGSLLNVAVLASSPVVFEHLPITCTGGCVNGFYFNICGTCGGAGQIEVPPENEDSDPIFETCHECAGIGQTESTCAVCGGSGKVSCTGSYAPDGAGEYPATCAEGSYIRHVCTVCGGEGRQRTGDPLGHVFNVVGEPCAVCQKSYYVNLIIDVTMPEAAEQAYIIPVQRGSGSQYIEILDTLKNDASMGWQSDYSLLSTSVNSERASLVYKDTEEYPGKYNELMHGFAVNVGEEDINVGDVIITSGLRNQYFVYNYKETVAGTWSLAPEDMDQYSAVAYPGAAGLGPVFGEAYTVSPKTIEGYTPYRYAAALWMYWNGLLNSGNYDANYPTGTAPNGRWYYNVDMSTLGISLDASTRVFTGLSMPRERNFSAMFVYYYALLRPVTYYANNETDDATSASYIRTDTVTVADNTFTRAGYTFTGWNTAADGSGTDYAPADTFVMGAVEGVDLYAQWTPVNDDPFLPPDTNPTPPPEEPTTPPEEPSTPPEEPSTPPEEPENIPQQEVPATEAPVVEEGIPQEEPPMAEAPETGDSITLWLAVAALSGMGLVAMAVTSFKRKEDEV